MGDSDEEEMAAMRGSGRFAGRKPAETATAGKKPPPAAAIGDSSRAADTAASQARRRSAAYAAEAFLKGRGQGDEDDDAAMAPDVDEEVMAQMGFMGFGKKVVDGKAPASIEVHDGLRRGRRGSGGATVVASRGTPGGVQFGPRAVEAAAAAGFDQRVSKAKEKAAAAAVAKARAAEEEENEPVGMVAEEEEYEAPDDLPLPGQEMGVLPVSHEVSIPAHEKVVTALAFDPKGSRMTTGSMDGGLKFFDFNGMSEAKSAFRTLEPVPDHMVQAVSYNVSGGVVLVVCSDAHARLYDRDGGSTLVQQTVKGDMYVRQLEHTQGHTQSLTDGVCHPLLPECWLTSSLDGTLRLWDLQAKAVGMDQWLPCVHTLKCVDRRNVCVGGSSGRGGGLHPTCCTYSPDAKKIIGGCTDGSLQMFFEKPRYLRPDRIVREGHGAAVSGIAFIGTEGHLFATRALDNTLKIWDCRMFSDAKGPVKVWDDLPAGLDKSGVCASPDGKYIVAGTSFRKGALGNASLRVYDTASFSQVKSLDFGTRSVVKVAWPRDINQIVVGTSTGEVTMLYSPFSSTKGAMHFVGRKARSKDALEIEGQTGGTGPIFNMTDKDDIQKFYTTGHGNMTKIRRHEARQSQKTKGPIRPSSLATEHSGGDFAALVLKAGAQRITNIREKDSQKALLAYAEGGSKANNAKPHGNVFDSAYAGSQPMTLLDYTVQESEGDKRMRERLSGDFCRKCGQKLCRCVDYSVWGDSGKSAPPGAKRMKPAEPLPGEKKS